MQQTHRELLYGIEPALALTTLAVATLDAIAFPVLFWFADIPVVVLQCLFSVSAVVAAVLFLRLMGSRAFRFAMSKANEELTAGQPFRFRYRKLNDPEWGLFGSKLGTGYLVPLRSTLMVEFIIAGAFVAQARPLLMLQTFVGAALTIMLTQSQLRMHFPLAD